MPYNSYDAPLDSTDLGIVYKGREAARQFCRWLTDDDHTSLTFEGYFPKSDPRSHMRGSAARVSGTFEEVLPTLEAWEAERRNVYVRVNEGGPKKDEITAVRAISIEFDADEEHHSQHQALPESWHLDPTLVVRRGESLHAHWVVEDCPVERFDELQMRVHQHYGSDPNALGIQRVWRLPGFRHPLFPEQNVELVINAGPDLSGTAYGLGQFEMGLPGQIIEPDFSPNEARRTSAEPITAQMFRAILSYIDPTYENDHNTWAGLCLAILDPASTPLAYEDASDDMDTDRRELLNAWCSGELWRDRTGDETFEPETYRGDDELLVRIPDSPRRSGPRVSLGTFIRLAQENGYDGPIRIPGRLVHLWYRMRANGVAGADAHSQLEDIEESRPLSAAELASGEFPRAEHLWDGLLLKEHVNLLYGDGGSGKTLLALQIGAAVASGQPLFGRDVQQMPVLLVLAEDDYGETKYRLMKACEDLDVNLSELSLEIWCRPGEDSTLAIVRDTGEWKEGAFYPSLIERLAELGPCLCVLDTAADMAALDEIKRPPVNAFCKQVLGRFCREHRTTILLNAHPSKASMQDGHHYAGSTAWNNAVRQRLVLQKDDKTKERTLKVAKSNYGPELELSLYYSGDVLRSLSEREQREKELDEREAVLRVVLDMIQRDIQVVRGNGSGQKPKDVAKEVFDKERINLTPNEVRDHLNALEREGKLKYEGADKSKRGHRAGFRKDPNG